MKFYRETGVVSAQIQATGVSLQIGSTIWGVAPESWFRLNGRRKGASPFFARVIINAPEHQRGLRVALEFRTRWFTLKRIGKASADCFDYQAVGWYLRRQMCSGVDV